MVQSCAPESGPRCKQKPDHMSPDHIVTRLQVTREMSSKIPAAQLEPPPPPPGTRHELDIHAALPTADGTPKIEL